MLGAAYVRGLQAGGVGAVGKHFPGEGASRGDPHRGLPTAPVTRAVLQAQDVVPFRDCGADAIMMSHVRFPALGEGPASLSPATYELLRGAAGFTGVAMTDGLEMKSIRQRYGLGPAAVLALRAGADMVSVFWSPAKVREAYGAVLSAARSGALSLARLDEAVLRVLRAKLRRGVRVGTPVRGAAASVSAGAAE